MLAEEVLDFGYCFCAIAADVLEVDLERGEMSVGCFFVDCGRESHHTRRK